MVNDQLLDLLRQAFDRVRERQLPKGVDPAQYERWKQDFVFHLTDWTLDIDRLQALFQHPERFNEKTASDLIVSFLIHVIPHLNAAGRLLLDEISDPFAPAETERRDKTAPAATH